MFRCRAPPERCTLHMAVHVGTYLGVPPPPFFGTAKSRQKPPFSDHVYFFKCQQQPFTAKRFHLPPKAANKKTDVPVHTAIYRHLPPKAAIYRQKPPNGSIYSQKPILRMTRIVGQLIFGSPASSCIFCISLPCTNMHLVSLVGIRETSIVFVVLRFRNKVVLPIRGDNVCREQCS